MYDEKPGWSLWLLCGQQTVGRQMWKREGLLGDSSIYPDESCWFRLKWQRWREVVRVHFWTKVEPKGCDDELVLGWERERNKIWRWFFFGRSNLERMDLPFAFVRDLVMVGRRHIWAGEPFRFGHSVLLDIPIRCASGNVELGVKWTNLGSETSWEMLVSRWYLRPRDGDSLES